MLTPSARIGAQFSSGAGCPTLIHAFRSTRHCPLWSASAGLRARTISRWNTGRKYRRLRSRDWLAAGPSLGFPHIGGDNPVRPEKQLPSPVPVRLRHPELADRLALEVEFDQDCSLITDNPAIMTGLDDDDLRSRELDSAAVRILDVDLAAGQEPDVRVHAEIGADDRFHVLGPAKSRRVDDAFHATGAGSNSVNLGAADFAAFAAGDRCEKWIIAIHETSTRALPSPLNSIRAGWLWGLVLANTRAGRRCSGGMLWHTAVRTPVVSFRGRCFPGCIRNAALSESCVIRPEPVGE